MHAKIRTLVEEKTLRILRVTNSKFKKNRKSQNFRGLKSLISKTLFTISQNKRHAITITNNNDFGVRGFCQFQGCTNTLFTQNFIR